jgi:FixJ family two-component response regulator
VKYSAKVYVIDQDKSLLNLTEQLLEEHGYDVKCFTSVDSFIAQHHPTQVGCVLIDLMMPDLASTDLLSFLRESKSLLSAIVLTSLIDPATSPNFTNSSICLLKKPYEVQALLDTLSEGVAKSVHRRAERRGGR